jgi:hypothetical protein
MHREPTDAELAAYLDEALPVDEMSRLEQALRNNPELLRRLSGLATSRERGGHSLGEIWRRRRLSCPEREMLGSYLLGVLAEPERRYIDLHVREVGCRVCQANLADLSAQQDVPAAAVRRTRYFQSSAGMLRARKQR